MGHSLQALIIPVTAAERLEQHPAAVHAVQITGSLLLVPVTDDLYDLLVHNEPEGEMYADVFWKFHAALMTFGSDVAGTEPYAYVETDYFGGQGSQAAGAWRQSETLVEPRSAPIGPINDVLRVLGVTRSKDVDEFDTAGLSRHRHMEDWLSEPRFRSLPSNWRR